LKLVCCLVPDISLLWFVYRGDAELAYKVELGVCAEQEVMESWNLVKNVADFVMAVNALPWRPFLWAGRLKPSRNAAFGTISSLVGLFLFIQAQRKEKRKTLIDVKCS